MGRNAYIRAIFSWRRLADGNHRGSLASRARRRRFALFEGLLESIPPPISILDVGGTARYWETMGFSRADVTITILNVSLEPSGPLRQVRGDARDMTQFSDREFDVVYSNSVIEHVGDRGDQARVAGEIQRVGRRYLIQTPNLWFPLEPHFMVPGFQFLPISARTRLVNRFNLGHVGRRPDPGAAKECVESIRLLAASDLRRLFPDAVIYRERILGLTKSLMAAGGWNSPSSGSRSQP